MWAGLGTCSLGGGFLLWLQTLLCLPTMPSNVLLEKIPAHACLLGAINNWVAIGEGPAPSILWLLRWYLHWSRQLEWAYRTKVLYSRNQLVMQLLLLHGQGEVPPPPL